MFDFGFIKCVVETTESLDGSRVKFYKFMDALDHKWVFVEQGGEALLCSVEEYEDWEGWGDIFFTNALNPSFEIKMPRAEGTIGYIRSDLGLADPKFRFVSFLEA